MIKTIRVKANHIDANMHYATYCPVALAIKEVCPGSDPHVYGREIIFDGSITQTVIAPDEVRDFVMNYDSHLPVEPFEFDLDIPDWVICND